MGYSSKGYISPEYCNEDGSLNLNGAIYCICNLPDFYLYYKCKVIADWSAKTGLGQYLAGLREIYIAKAYWLSYFLLGRTDLELELNITHKADYKPIAEESVAFYNLIEEVWQRIAPEYKSQINSPGRWLLNVEAELLDINLTNSGVLGEANPTGKREMYQSVVKEVEDFLEVSNFVPSEKSQKMGAVDFLISQAIRFAQTDEDFEDFHYLPFWKKIKRSYRDREKSPCSAFYLNSDNQVKIIRRGKRAKNGKGFG
jgi:hypothetical protein